MRNELIKLLNEARNKFLFTDYYNEAVADYLLSNGVIIQPCKVGDDIFVICRSRFNHRATIKKSKVAGIKYVSSKWYVSFEDLTVCAEIGLNAFLSHEEAEKALAERNE